ncbi:hypothetical protein BH11PSE11_BH11PSE11_21410 [soil metagenome]
MTRARIVIVLVFLAGALLFALAGLRRPVILVVHSFDNTIPWARGEATGLASVFDGASDVRILDHYLDANDAAPGKLESRVKSARALITAGAPQAVILMDNVAQKHVGTPLLGGYPGWIIFGGIAATADKLPPSSLGKIAGISERTPWTAIEALLREFARQKGIANPRVALINDAGSAADEEAAGFRSYAWRGMQLAGVWRCKDSAEWRQALPAIRTSADLVVIGDYGSLELAPGMSRAEGRSEIARITLNELSAPQLALSGYAVNDGFPVGILPSPAEQGEEAARLALTAVRNGAPAYRYGHSRQFLVVANEPVLAARALILPELYASYARQVGPLIRTAGN